MGSLVKMLFTEQETYIRKKIDIFIFSQTFFILQKLFVIVNSILVPTELLGLCVTMVYIPFGVMFRNYIMMT